MPRFMSPAPDTADEIRDVNTRYHDGAAADYDAKWGIDFGEIGRTQVLGKLRKALDGELRSFDRALELGAGTGYFSLNLLQAGVISQATCTDISQGMVDALARNAELLDLDVDARIADAEALPFADGSFDLVFGHAVLHHLPDLDQAWREIHRVLAPGGVAVFAGEPSEYGDRIANVPKRAASRVAPVWRTLMRAAPASEGNMDGGAVNHQLESMVDVHAFTPDAISAGPRAAGFTDVRVRGEELLANWFGWANRALEATADPETVPWAWKMYAFKGYVGLQHVDRVLLETRLPPAVFYNLMITAQK
jgi:SAM-dependent methyltransferase